VNHLAQISTPPERGRSLRALGLALTATALLLLGSAGVGRAGPVDVAATVARLAPSDALSCRVLPADNAWNQRVDALPVHPKSTAWVQSIGTTERLRALFSATDGIPYQLVSGSTAPASVEIERRNESDPGPYRLPDDAKIDDEDGRVLVVDRDRCLLTELRGAERTGPAAWKATSGALFDLGANDLRPDGWRSADEAGLPIFPGLVRLDEVDRGEITHALRFTAPQLGRAHFWPARHGGSDGDEGVPPAGSRFRLRSTVNPAAFSPRARVILTALQRYGMLLADSGPAWGLSGVPDPDWDEDSLAELEEVFGTSFEAVDVSPLIIDNGSGQALAPPSPTPTGTPPATKTPAPTSTTAPTTMPEPSATVTPTPSPEPSETPKPTRTPRPTEVGETPEPTDTPAPTSTTAPTNTPAPTATKTFTPAPTATWTLTPTNTPIPIPTAFPAPYCAPRPPLSIQTEVDAGGRVKVTISVSTSTWVPDNTIQTLRAVALTNATVQVNGTTLSTAGATRTFPDPTRQIVFYVERGPNKRLGYSATFGVADVCGEWQSFAGAGPAVN
jgi:hypothetical protein